MRIGFGAGERGAQNEAGPDETRELGRPESRASLDSRDMYCSSSDPGTNSPSSHNVEEDW